MVTLLLFIAANRTFFFIIITPFFYLTACIADCQPENHPRLASVYHKNGRKSILFLHVSP